VEYDADAVMCHPPVVNARHDIWYRYDGRNRVLLARRNLPWPLAFVFLLDWMILTVVRERSVAAIRGWLKGFAEGWRMDPGPRPRRRNAGCWPRPGPGPEKVVPG
jgi:hypothetical protein